MLGHIKSDRSEEDLLYQAMIELGLPLTSVIKERKILNQPVFFVLPEDARVKGEPSPFKLIACLSRKGGVTRDLAFELVKYKAEYAVFCEDGFTNDSARVNVDETFRHLAANTRLKVL